MGKRTFLSIFSVVFILLFVFLDVPLLLRLSFFINYLLLWFITYYNIYIEKRFSPFIGTFVVFNLLFFVAAPLVQISSIMQKGFQGTGKHIQNLPFSEFGVFRANTYILIFILTFFISYLYLKKLKFNFKINKRIPYNNTPLVLVVLAVISLVIIATNFSTIVFQYKNDFYKEVEQTSLSSYLMVQKFLFFIPLAGLFISHYYLKDATKKTKNYFFVVGLLICFLLFVLILKNPLTEKRNALGPIYITLIYLFYRKSLDSNFKVIKFMFFSMVLLFPIVSIITHARVSLKEIVSKENFLAEGAKTMNIENAFNSLHYDAYPCFLATIDYCDRNDITYGKQLVPVFFFFVPRSSWHDKPEVTGFKIGNYLIDSYGFNFNNLANPYVSEAYINFGLFGIILFAIVLAMIFVWQMRWIDSNDRLKSIFAFYFSIYLIYFLRGDLANTYMLILSTFVAVVVFPKGLYLLVNYYAKK